MSGHSKWAGIKHKKAVIDAKRGKIFTKLGREITVAARQGGGIPDNNPRLRKAMEDARSANMPAENIKRALQRGTGEIPGAQYEELMYEGYGPSGVAVLVEATTDNKNRTVSEIRKIFAEHGGSLAESGSVGWVFSPAGYISVEKTKIKEDEILGLALDAGAQDFRQDDTFWEIITSVGDLEKVKKALEAKKIALTLAHVTKLPSTYIPMKGAEAERMLALMDALEEHEDVKEIYANFDIPREIVERISK